MTADHDAAIRFLLDRIDYERMQHMPYGVAELRLSRMTELLDLLGSPQRGMPIVHVAGTKGKGSTSAAIAAVLSAAGYRTGLFTSPHLERPEERIAVNGLACQPEELGELIADIRPAVEELDRLAARRGGGEIGPTYFEITTAAAFLHFARFEVDLAVLEVGLGGRFDATNVCTPLVSVITSISLDHTRQLGDTLSAIAGEKAGIVKPGVPVVSGVVAEEPREVIRETCRQRGCRLIELGTDFDFEYRPARNLQERAAAGRMDFRQHGTWDCQDIALGLMGRHQAANAAVALAALEELRQAGWNIPEEAMRRGLTNLTWPARVEVVARRPAVVLDAAHNVASIEALLDTLDESFSAARRLLVFATTQEKDVRGMIGRLLGKFDEVVFTKYLNNPRAVPPEEMQGIALELSGRRYSAFSDPAAAWDAMHRLATPDDLICITGSFFIAAEMRRQLEVRPIGK
jgi:dihydrofolate synthase/folylpolyglutamate synthase